MTAADSRIDNEVLKAKLDASVGIAQRLIDSWLPASDDTSTDSIFTQSKHLKGRPARWVDEWAVFYGAEYSIA